MSDFSSDDDDVVNELLGLSSPIKKGASPVQVRPRVTFARREHEDLGFDVNLHESFDAKPVVIMEQEALDLIKQEEELDQLLADDLLEDEHKVQQLNRKDETIAKEMSEDLLENPLDRRYVAYVKANLEQLQDFYFIDEPAIIEDRPAWASAKALLRRTRPLDVPPEDFLREVAREQNQTMLKKLYECAPMEDVTPEAAREFVRLLGGSQDIMEGARPKRLEPKKLLPPMVVTAYKLSILVRMTGPRTLEEVTRLVVLFLMDARSVQPYLSDRMSNGKSTVEILNECVASLCKKEPIDLKKHLPIEDPALTYRLLSALWLNKDNGIKNQTHWLCLEAIITMDRYDEYELDIKDKTRQLVTKGTEEDLVHSMLKFLELWSNSVLAKSGSLALEYTALRIKLLEKLIYFYFPHMPQYASIASELSAPQETGDSDFYGSSKPRDEELIYIHLRKLLVSLSNEYFVLYGGTASTHPVHGECLLRLSALQHKLDRSISKSFL